MSQRNLFWLYFRAIRYYTNLNLATLWIYSHILALAAAVTRFAYGEQTIYHCLECDIYFSETFATPIAGLTTPLSRIITILKARSERMSLNATARTHNVSKKSVIDEERRLGALKPTLMLYTLLHQLIHQEIEGNELYLVD